MKKVTLIHGGWLSAPNGASSVLRIFQNKKEDFETRGIYLELCTLDKYAPREASEFKKENINRSLIKEWIQINSKSSSLLSFINIYGTYLRHAKKIISFYKSDSSIDKSSNNIVFFHDIFTCYYFLKANKNKNKVVLVLHNNGDTYKMLCQYFPLLDQSIIYKYFIFIENYVFERVTRIGFVAENPMIHFMNLHPAINFEKLFFIHNGIPSNLSVEKYEKHTNECKYRICCVGSISKRKGQDILIESFSKLTDSLKDKIHVVFVGDGSERTHCERMVEKFNLKNNFTFVGFTTEVDKHLAWSNIFILPSRDEGFPMSILEAMKCGKAIFSTKIAGIPEMVFDNINGKLFNPNVDELYEILSNLNEYDLLKMGEKSKTIFLEKFTDSLMIEKYAKMFMDL